MKATGIVRKVDELGRIVIPIELRRTLGIDIKDPIEVFADENFIMLKKYNTACCLCGEMSDLVNYRGKNICKKCLGEL